VQAAELGAIDAYILRLSYAELRNYAGEHGIALVALVPYGAVFGSLVPNYWISESYAFRSGGIDRLASWIGADPLLFAFAQFIERRLIQQLPASTSGRMFAVFERNPKVAAYSEPSCSAMPKNHERGPEAWQAEFGVHAQHEPNRAFAIAFLLAAWPARLPVALREQLPAELLRELDGTERAAHVDDICADVVGAWRSAVKSVDFHGVDLADAFATLLRGELRTRLEANE
jgi:hypothetical protein